ncbi:DNA repair protein RecN [Riemerella columbina]|uniref:DNA repair protein RecN n=1 Tax=Riemerella columbina TaxID=103810 RepID=UPI0026701296|nr:DNA repair protein RecN [Riemerella columbina]WKS95619.1 DNA repair protein RecN [Riemerella columbina]
MLSRIFIQNFALIERLDIPLHRGLQVITGETGAGKSIILGALRLIMGERADLKTLANAEQKSIVEAEFEINNGFQDFFSTHDLDFENPTIIRREILPSGKSRAFVNDVPVTLDTLKELSAQLIDIHSQFETSQLFSEAYQFGIIDGIAKNQGLIQEYQVLFSEFTQLKRDLAKYQNQLAEGLKEKDYQEFLLAELEEIDLENIDFEDLKNQLSVQENAGEVSEVLAEISQRFNQEGLGVLEGLHHIKSLIYKIAEVSPQLESLSERLDSAYEEIKDIAYEIDSTAENIQIDAFLLEELTQKVNAINALQAKHQVYSVSELIDIKNTLAASQNQLEDLEFKISEAEKQLASQEENLSQLATTLSAQRAAAIPKFVTEIEQLLKQLGLEKAKIEVELTEVPQFHLLGKDKIAILFQANTGFPLKPIQTAISGGERSRVMLAIKKIMAENTALPTLILDEIDTGVSGKVAEEIGFVMKAMAETMQLIVITHLAQVAAKGDDNYKVVKQDVAGKTQSNILPLSEEEKLQEIAQLLSGSKITAAALEQAKELIQS